MRGPIPRELLQYASDEELDGYVEWLEATLDAEEPDSGEWKLQDRQQDAEDALADLDPTMSHELLYGGAAGPGKTEFVLWHGYNACLRYPGLRVLMLRRTFPELRRSLVLRSLERFDRTKTKYVITESTWKFNNGSYIEFGYCVGPDTPILMGDGSYKRMIDVRVGDMVGTLEGPRRVTRHWHVGVKPAVEITLPGREPIIASDSHAVMDGLGRWLTPRQMRRDCGDDDGSAVAPQEHGRNDRRGRFSNTRDERQPRRSSVLLTLHGPASRSPETTARDSADLGATSSDRSASRAPGWKARFATAARLGGALLRWVREAAQGGTPSRAGADTRSHARSSSDDRSRIRGRSPSEVASYSHPYTMEDRPLCVDVRLSSGASIAPAGERDLWDMTVEGANHYVSLGGIVHKNCETDNDVYQYQSAEYDIVIWDELTQWKSSFPYLYLFSRCRSRLSIMARGFVPHVVAATNPGGVGGGWVKARFVDVSPPNARYVAELTDDDGNPIDIEGPTYGTRIFVPGVLGDNKYINRRAYVANLANLPQAQREALLDGSWDVIEGQYFPEWSRDVHVVAPFKIPEYWTRIRCIDYGYAAPFCCLWIAFDNDRAAWVYRELYERELTPKEQVAKIMGLQQPGESISYTIVDPSTVNRTGVGVPVAQQYVDAGMPVRPGMNARISGWARLREFLRPEVIPPDQAGAEPTIHVGLHVFSTCTNFIRTFPMLVHDQKNPEDLDSDGEDHAADAMRYGLMSRPGRSRAPKKEPSTLEGRMAEARHNRELQRMGRRQADHPTLGNI